MSSDTSLARDCRYCR